MRGPLSPGELRSERDGLKEIIAEPKAPLQELHSKQAEVQQWLNDPEAACER